MANRTRPETSKLAPTRGAEAEPAKVGSHAAPPKGGHAPSEGGATVKHPGRGKRLGATCC